MTFAIHCSWADYCASQDGTIEANSYDELFEEMEKFFEHACGFTGVEAFEISNPYLEDWEDDDDDDGEEPDMYEWDWDNLKRYQNLTDVWNRVKKEIKETFGKDYFNKGEES